MQIEIKDIHRPEAQRTAFDDEKIEARPLIRGDDLLVSGRMTDGFHGNETMNN